MTEQELYYFRSILRGLREWQELAHSMVEATGPSIGSEVLADNINWLDCFIEKNSRGGKD